MFARTPEVKPRLLTLVLWALGGSLAAQVTVDTLAASSLAGGLRIDGPALRYATRASCADPLTGGEVARLDWRRLAGRGWNYQVDHCELLSAEVYVAEPLALHITSGFHEYAELTVWRGDSLLYRGRSGNAVPPVERSYPHATAEQMRNLFEVRFPRPGRYGLVLAYSNPAGESIHATNVPAAFYVTLAAAGQWRRDFYLATAGGLLGGLLMLLGFQLSRLVTARSRVDISFTLLLVAMALFVTFDTGLMQSMLYAAVVPSYLIFPLGGIGLAALALFTRDVFAEVAPNRSVERLLDAVAVLLILVGTLPLLGYGAFDLGLIGDAGALRAFPAVFRAGVSLGLLVFVAVLGYEVYASRKPALYILATGLGVLTLATLATVTQATLEPYGPDIPVLAAYLALIGPVFSYLVPTGILIMCLSFAVAVALLGRDRELHRDRHFNLRLAEVEMRALRAQMNPHFLFNGLNSIKGFVIDNDRDQAADYLSKFARLIRLVLENSSSSLVSLNSELEALRLYLELERERLGGAFDFSIACRPGVDPEQISIPPTIIQPYAENAVWHGLRHRERPGGHLSIAVERVDDGATQITIEDNGVGRAAAREIANRRRRQHRSRGLAITDERLTLLRELHGVEMSTAVEDLFDERGSAGTRVVVRIESARTGRATGPQAPPILESSRAYPLS